MNNEENLSFILKLFFKKGGAQRLLQFFIRQLTFVIQDSGEKRLP